ncbi:MAG: hypothetical protein E8D45_07615 [Nitrospira sp.]|nr:MAG: hypothetical protein E8D45_07615 [Nitrospira sp.]
MIPTAKQLFLPADSACPETPTVRDEMEKKFFGFIRLRNGVSKTTEIHRMADVDRAVIAVCARVGLASTSVLDVAVSSGISTCEWLESLQEAGFHPEMTATDLCMHAYLVRLFPGCDALVDREGYPLQFDFCGIALRPWSPRRYYILGNYFWTSCYRALFARIADRLGLFERLRALHGHAPAPDDPVITAKVQLVTRRLRNHKDIELLDDDIFQPTSASLLRRFDVVRAANILNLDYFSAQQLREGVAHLRERLTGPGAFLVIVRTEHDGFNHGSLFRLNENRSFSLLQRVGRGSEIEDMVLTLSAAPAVPAMPAERWCAS